MDHMAIFDKASSIFSAIVSSSRVFLNNRSIVPKDYAFYMEVDFMDLTWPVCERSWRSFGWMIFKMMNFFFEFRNYRINI